MTKYTKVNVRDEGLLSKAKDKLTYFFLGFRAISRNKRRSVSMIAGLILGIVSSPKNLLSDVFRLLQIQIEVNEAVKTLHILNSEIEVKNHTIETQKLSIDELDDVQAQLQERIQYIQQSGELAKLEQMREEAAKLQKLHETLKQIGAKHEQRFNIASLINFIQNLWQKRLSRKAWFNRHYNNMMYHIQKRKNFLYGRFWIYCNTWYPIFFLNAIRNVFNF